MRMRIGFAGLVSATLSCGAACAVMHDWVVANENMAKALAETGYHYRFVFARNAGHTGRAVKEQTLPEALEYIWKSYPISK